MLLSCFAMMLQAQETVKVTLTVDVSNETVDPTGVHVAGSFQDPVWTANGTPMTDMGDGIWSVEITVDTNSTFEYKFLLGDDWGKGNEGLPGNAGCIVGNGNTNRVLTVGEMDMTVGPVCYNTCGACPKDGESQVTFAVDLSKAATINSPIYVSGSFPDGMWNETYEMRDDNNDKVYTTTLVLPEGDYQYKFRNGADGWESVPGACENGGNRFVTVGMDDQILDAVCLGECGPCVVKNILEVTMSVDMTNVIADIGLSPLGVHVAGNFQAKAGYESDWTPRLTMLTDEDGDNIFSVTFMLEEGEYQYKFLNGDDWGTEESVPAECRSNGNRVFTIAGNNGDQVEVGPLCFGQCEAECPALLDPINVTFRVDMSNEFISPEGLFVAGDFIANAKWVKDSFLMAENPTVPGIYEYTATFRPGAKYAYKYFNGGLDGGDNGEETNDFIAGGCGVDNGFGGSNREMDLTGVTEDIVLPAFIFNSCDRSTLVNNEEIDYFTRFEVVPNPARDFVEVRFDATSERHNVQLYDVRGALVYESGMTSDNRITIDRGTLADGLYIGRVINSIDAGKTFKVMFQ